MGRRGEREDDEESEERSRIAHSSGRDPEGRGGSPAQRVRAVARSRWMLDMRAIWRRLMAETLAAPRGVGTAGNRRPAVRVPVPPRPHQAELPETAPVGRGVSRTTGTQKAGWARMRGRAGMVVLLAAAALAGAAQTVVVDGGGDRVLHE